MTIDATIRWAAPSTRLRGVWTVVAQDEQPGGRRIVLWTRQVKLAAFCERANQTPRPVLALTFDYESKQLEDAVQVPTGEYV